MSVSGINSKLSIAWCEPQNLSVHGWRKQTFIQAKAKYQGCHVTKFWDERETIMSVIRLVPSSFYKFELLISYWTFCNRLGTQNVKKADAKFCEPKQNCVSVFVCIFGFALFHQWSWSFCKFLIVAVITIWKSTVWRFWSIKIKTAAGCVLSCVIVGPHHWKFFYSHHRLTGSSADMIN